MHRFLAVALLVVTAGGSAGATPPRPTPAALTEDAAVALALARPALGERTRGAVQAEHGRARTEAALPNPELAYTHSRTFGALGTTEQTLTVAQAFDLAPRRSRRAAAARARARAARAQGDAEEASVALEVRRGFYQALHHQLRLEALGAWSAQLDRASGILERRQQGGDSARWAVKRLDRERVGARSRLATERATYEGAVSALLARLGSAAQRTDLGGTLLPAGAPPPLTEGASSAQGPALRALDLRARAAAEDRRAAEGSWAPSLRVEGGWTGVEAAGGRADGFVAALGLTLPLWDRGGGAAEAARGEERALLAHRELLGAERGGAVQAAHRAATALRAAAVELERDAAPTTAALLQAAESGYEEGELELLELLDAYRGAAEDRLALLELQHAARQARLTLDALLAGGLP